MHWLPSFKHSVVSSFPVSQYRHCSEARLKIEGKRCFVLKLNVHSVILRRDRQFYVGNDLAFSLREPENAGNFMVRQFEPSSGAAAIMYCQVNIFYYQVKII